MAGEPEYPVGSVETGIDEMFAQLDQQNGSSNVLQGDHVPDALKGKSLDDAFKYVEQLQNTLRVNTEVMNRLASRPPEPTRVVVEREPPAPTVAPEQQISDEDLAQLFAENPLKAVRFVTDQNNRFLARALEERLAPLGQGTISQAEAEAKRKYPLEFEIFSEEIKQHRSMVPQDVFANPQSWDQMIGLIRGMNVQRYVSEVQRRSGVAPIETPTNVDMRSGGFVPPSREAPSSTDRAAQLDNLQRKVAAEFGFANEAEYIRFSKMGDVIGG